jgi:hypothetical protein
MTEKMFNVGAIRSLRSFLPIFASGHVYPPTLDAAHCRANAQKVADPLCLLSPAGRVFGVAILFSSGLCVFLANCLHVSALTALGCD